MIKQTLPTVDELTRLIEDATSGGCHPSVIQRLSILRYFVLYRPTVLELCRHFGISRSTFHRWMERFNASDPLSLQDRSQDARNDHPITVSAEAIELIRRYRHEAPLLGKERIASLLRQQHGITVSASTVGRVIDRECLYFAETPLHWKKRVEHGAEDWTAPQEQPSDPAMEKSVPDSPQQLSPVVHVHVPDTAVSGSSFSGFVKFIVVASLLINIVFVSMLFGMALFERTTRSIIPRMDATTIPAAQSFDGLHGAPPNASFAQ